MSKQNKITPDLVARHLGTSAAMVRKGMEDGTLPIGIVECNGNKKSFIILPKALFEVTGIRLNGYEPPANARAEIDYSMLAKSILAELAIAIGKEATI